MSMFGSKLSRSHMHVIIIVQFPTTAVKVLSINDAWGSPGLMYMLLVSIISAHMLL